MDRRERALLVQAPETPHWWARAYRIMPSGEPWRIMADGAWHMPYLYEILDAWHIKTTRPQTEKGHRQVVSKCAQTGFTESAINLALWFLEVQQEGVMYGLPSEDQIKSFVQARVNPSVRNSPHIAKAFKDTDNTDVKLGWNQALYFRGSISRSKLREIPVGLIIRDEYGEMDERGREMMLARLGASQYKWIFDCGNPHFPETGIDELYLRGDQSVWALHCDSCGEWEEPRWPDSIQKVGDEYGLVCPNCGLPVNKADGRWIPRNPGAPYRSFRLSQMISPRVEPWEIARQWETANGNATRVQEFYNSTLGLPYAPEGTRIDDEILSALPRSGEMIMASKDATVMGVDINPAYGNTVVIRKLSGGVIWAGTATWEEMDRLMINYTVDRCGIDIRPETTKAKEFAGHHLGKVILIAYSSSPMTSGKDGSIISQTTDDGIEVWTVARTEAIDGAFQRLLTGEESLASNLPEDFFAHFRAMTRQIVDTGGKEYATWVESGPDHYAHSFTYSELVRDNRPVWDKVGMFL